MLLLLIRHGQSTNNLAAEQGSGEVGREPDPPLTDVGHAQAAALADWLADQGWIPDRLYSSLMTRTIQTAAPLAARFDLRIEARDNLHEAGGPYLGPYLEATPHPGSTRQHLQALTPAVELPSVATESGWWRNNVETNAVAFARAQAVIAWLREQAEHPDAPQRMAIVAHGAFLSMMITALVNPAEAAAAVARNRGGAEDLPVWYEFANTSTSMIDLRSAPNQNGAANEHRATVAWLNRVDHLAGMPPQGPPLTSAPFPPAVPPSRQENP